MFILCIFDAIALLSVYADVSLVLSSGELCAGARVTLTCFVLGNVLGWTTTNSTSTRLFPASNGPTNEETLTFPFTVQVTGAMAFNNGSTRSHITSVVAGNLTIDVNGTTLKCSDGLTGPNVHTTTIKTFEFILKGITPCICGFFL